MSSLAAGMKDEALFHVLLLTSALHLRYLTENVEWDETEKGQVTEIISHKLAAIRKVNEKLRDPPSSISDEIIHAVTFMAMAEVSFISFYLDEIVLIASAIHRVWISWEETKQPQMLI
jgi:hypothetical protein